MEKINILGVDIHKITMKEAVDKTINEFFNQDEEMKMIVTPNPEFVMSAKEDEEFRMLINEADLIIPDGIGIVYASRIMKNPLNERVAGFDFTENILRESNENGYTVFLLGAKPGVAEKAANNMKEKYTNLKVVGTHHGYFKEEEESKVIDMINEVKPDYLIVGLGAPRQEKFIKKYKKILKVKAAIGNGGAIDGFAGVVKRAPILFQKAGLEWFYRLMQDPSRFRRMTKLPKFMLEVLNAKKR